MVLADPTGSVLADYVHTGHLGTAGSWLVEGIGEDFLPPLLDLSRVRHAETITDFESLTTARDLLRQEGILAGSSSGTLVAAALRYCRIQAAPKRVVTFVCDSGNKYLSKMYNDHWMADQGLRRDKGHGDLRDLIVRRFADGAVVSLSPDDPLTVACTRMRLYDISQLPVIEQNRIIGIVDESDLLLAVRHDAAAFGRPIRELMSSRLQTVSRHAQLSDLLPILDAGHVAIVADDLGFHGLITRIDLLNYLRRQQRSA
jgi:cystathionine beta-synthase